MKPPVPGASKPANEGGNLDDHAPDTLGSHVNISVFLGILILTVFIMPSIGFGANHEGWYNNIVFTVLLGAGITIAWRRRGLFVFSALISIFAFAIRCIALWMPSRSWQLGSEVATILVIMIIEWILLLQIFRRTGAITAVSTQGAIAIYLLFGLAWANAYLIAMQLKPNSFHSTVGLSSSYVSEWYYYSYVTLTTLQGHRDDISIAHALSEFFVGRS